jgi:hypothetical protein
VDVLVVLGAWAGGSVVISLAVGTAIARADRRSRAAGAARDRSAPRSATPAQVLALLPRPRSAVADAAADGLLRAP